MNEQGIVRGISAKLEAVTISYAVLEAKDAELDRLRARNKELCLILETILNGSGYPSYVLVERARALLAPDRLQMT